MIKNSTSWHGLVFICGTSPFSCSCRRVCVLAILGCPYNLMPIHDNFHMKYVRTFNSKSLYNVQVQTIRLFSMYLERNSEKSGAFPNCTQVMRWPSQFKLHDSRLTAQRYHSKYTIHIYWRDEWTIVVVVCITGHCTWMNRALKDFRIYNSLGHISFRFHDSWIKQTGQKGRE